MTNDRPVHKDTGLEQYFQLFKPYEAQLRDFSGREGEHGHRFALLFRQALRLLESPLPINEIMPKMFLEVAHRYLEKEHNTVRHFKYEDNRHFFLSDLLDWLKIHERGRRMRKP